MRRLLGNKWLMLVLAIGGAVAGLAQSFYCHDFMWFARSGSIVVCAGVMLLWNSVLKGRQILDVVGVSGFMLDDPQHYEAVGEPVPDHVWEIRSIKLAVEWFGPIVTFVGTIVWGYGDLLNKLCAWPASSGCLGAI